MRNFILVFLFSCLATFSSFADPMIVWPSDMTHERINTSEVLGSWWAYTEDQFLELTLSKVDSGRHVRFEMTGKDSKVIASGYLEINMEYFKGEVQATYSKDPIQALLYKGADGFRIQFMDNNKAKTFDLFR